MKNVANVILTVAITAAIVTSASVPVLMLSSCDKDKKIAETTLTSLDESTAAEITIVIEETTTAKLETTTAEPEEETTTVETTGRVIPDDVDGELIGYIYTREQLEAMDNEKIGYGQGVNVDEENRPTGVNHYIQKYEGLDFECIKDNDGKIYLTFDMGYENGTTPYILDTLKEKGVKALFFCTGWYVKSQPELVERIIAEGHIIGNHGWGHKSLPELTIDEAVSEIMELHDYVLENFNYEMVYFRPPCGESSERAVAIANTLGYRVVMWSFAYYDYNVNDQPDRAYALERTTGAAHGGAIYLLHAVSEINTDILGEMIDNIRNRGYVFAEYK